MGFYNVVCEGLDLLWSVQRDRATRAADLASFKRSSELCSTVERLNNNAWSNENYTAPAREEILIALRLPPGEVSLFKCLCTHTHLCTSMQAYLSPLTQSCFRQTHMCMWNLGYEQNQALRLDVHPCVYVCVLLQVLCSEEKKFSLGHIPVPPPWARDSIQHSSAYQARCIPENTHKLRFGPARLGQTTQISRAGYFVDYSPCWERRILTRINVHAAGL